MSRTKVLIVDDEQTYRESLRLLLNQQGYLAEIAESGQAGLDKAISWVPDVVLLDLKMPGMDGYETAKKIRDHDRTAEVPIIAMTGLDRPENVLKALLAGFNLYVSKPCDQDELIGAIESLVTFADRRKRFEAITPPTGIGDLTEIDEEREQILEKLHLSLREQMQADVLAIGWRRPDNVGLFIVSNSHMSEEVISGIEDRIWRTVTEEKRPEPVVMIGEEGDILTIADEMSIPLIIAGDSYGALLVASGTEGAFDEKAKAKLEALAPKVAELCATSVVGPAVDASVDELVSDIEILLMRAGDGEHWASTMEGAVGGIRVLAIGGIDELGDEHAKAKLALIDDKQYDAYENHQLAQARGRGARVVPALRLYEHQLTDSQDRLAAFLLMSVLIGVMDAMETGCLHVLRRQGKPAGLLVFRRGALAWASSRSNKTSLLECLADVSGSAIGELRDVVASCLRETGRGFGDAVVTAGLVTEEQYKEALRTHFTVIVGELLGLEHPHLLWSTSVSVQRGSPTFDTAEIAMSSFAG